MKALKAFSKVFMIGSLVVIAIGVAGYLLFMTMGAVLGYDWEHLEWWRYGISFVLWIMLFIGLGEASDAYFIEENENEETW
jgi:hypothetical protein